MLRGLHPEPPLETNSSKAKGATRRDTGGQDGGGGGLRGESRTNHNGRGRTKQEVAAPHRDREKLSSDQAKRAQTDCKIHFLIVAIICITITNIPSNFNYCLCIVSISFIKIINVLMVC